MKVGPASDPMSDIGPLIDKANVARVEKVVEAAIADGAKAIVRGGPITVSGGEVRYIFWRRMGERRPGDMPLVDHRDTFPLHAFR